MQTIEDREDMNNYIELLILAYFKQFQEQYSFGDISRKIGLSELQVSDYISRLVGFKQLIYEDSLLQLTIEGINRLADSSLANYQFDVDIKTLFEGDRWPVTRIYCPHEFSKNRWRGNK